MATAAVTGAAALGFYVYLRQWNQCGYAGVADLPVPVETHARTITAPTTWSETIYLFKEALRYMYQETLGRWHAIDLFFGLAYLSRRGTEVYPAADIAAAGRVVNTAEVSPEAAQEMLLELQRVQRYMLYCQGLRHHKAELQRKHWHDLVGTEEADIISHSPVAGLLRPAYVILKDSASREVVLCVRGTHSRSDMFTSLTGTVKPHHVVTAMGVVLGYSHLGMLAAARWLLGRTQPLLIQALQDNPGYQLKIVGHSMGGGTAAMLTMMVREKVPELSEATAWAIACPACMTLQLAEGCAGFVTTLVHGTDIVPTFSSGSIDALRQEVTQSSWFADFQADISQRLSCNISNSMRGLRLQAAGAGQWTQRNIIQTAATSFRACYNSQSGSCYSRRPRNAAAASAAAAKAAGSSSGTVRTGLMTLTAGLLGGRAAAAGVGSAGLARGLHRKDSDAGSAFDGLPIVDADSWQDMEEQQQQQQQQQHALAEHARLLPPGNSAFLFRFGDNFSSWVSRGARRNSTSPVISSASAAELDTPRAAPLPSEAALVERALEACLLAADAGQLGQEMSDHTSSSAQQQQAQQQWQCQSRVPTGGAVAGAEGVRRPGRAGQLVGKVASHLGKRPAAPGKKDDDIAEDSASAHTEAAAAATAAASNGVLPVSTGVDGSIISSASAAAAAGTGGDATADAAGADGRVVRPAPRAAPASLRRRGWGLGEVLSGGSSSSSGWVGGEWDSVSSGLGGVSHSMLNLGQSVGQTGRLVLESTGHLLKGSVMFQSCAVPQPSLQQQQHVVQHYDGGQQQQQEQQQQQQAAPIITTAPGSSLAAMRMDRGLGPYATAATAASSSTARSSEVGLDDIDDDEQGQDGDSDDDASECDPDLFDHELQAGLPNGAGAAAAESAVAVNQPAMRASISALMTAASAAEDDNIARRHQQEEVAAERLLQEMVAAGVTSQSEMDLYQLGQQQQQQQQQHDMPASSASINGSNGSPAAGDTTSRQPQQQQPQQQQQQQRQQQQQCLEDKLADRAARRQMFPAGRILHLLPASVVAAAKAEQQQQQQQEGASSPSSTVPQAARMLPQLTAATGTAGLGDDYVLLEVPQQLYGRIRLCPSQVRDHFIPSYLVALRSVMAQLEQQRLRPMTGAAAAGEVLFA